MDQLPHTASDVAERAPVARGMRPIDFVTIALNALRNHIWLLLGITIGLTAVALVGISMMHPKYDAVTRLRIDPSRNPMADQGQLTLNAEAIDTEVGVMGSLDLAREVARRLNLERDPEFALPAEALTGLSADDRLNAVARRVMGNVNVGRDRLSYIIALGYRSRSAEKAAMIANAYAEAYLDTRVRSQVGTSERQATFFRQRLTELAKAVNIADSRLAAYRARSGISENSATGTIVDQQIAPLSSQLATAEADAASARSKAQVARSQVSGGGLDAVSEVRSSAVIGDLRRQRAEIVRNMGEVDATYGPRHPESIRVHQQLDAIDRQIREEAARVVSSLAAGSSAAQAQVDSLRSTMRSLEQQRAQNTLASADADRLQRDAQSARATYDKMSQLSLESTQGASGAIAQAEVVDRAQPPQRPTSPNRPLLSVLAFIVALTAGLAAVVVAEIVQGGLRTIAETESMTGLTVLAAIPRQGKRRALFGRKDRRDPADHVEEARATIYTEAVRNLRAALLAQEGAGSKRVIAVTSSLPNEGKTTIALSLARMMALSKTRVLLIDCDLRNAGLRDRAQQRRDVGLTHVLSGAVPYRDAVAADRTIGLDILTVTETVFTSRDVFGDGQMERLLAEARRDYDIVILDLPPVLGVADARAVASMADMVAFVIRWGATSPRAVERALAALENDGAKLTGVVLSMVDPTSEAAGGVYYSRAYSKYYQSV